MIQPHRFQEERMQNLARAFGEELPSELRRSVYTAIVEAPRILNRRWVMECPPGTFGCIVIVAAFAAVRELITKAKVDAIIDSETVNTKQRLGQMLMMSGDTVEQCWREWDAMDDAGRAAFVCYIRQLLNALPPEDQNHTGGRRFITEPAMTLVRKVRGEVAMACLLFALMPQLAPVLSA